MRNDSPSYPIRSAIRRTAEFPVIHTVHACSRAFHRDFEAEAAQLSGVLEAMSSLSRIARCGSRIFTAGSRAGRGKVKSVARRFVRCSFLFACVLPRIFDRFIFRRSWILDSCYGDNSSSRGSERWRAVGRVGGVIRRSPGIQQRRKPDVYPRRIRCSSLSPTFREYHVFWLTSCSCSIIAKCVKVTSARCCISSLRTVRAVVRLLHFIG